MDNQEKVIAEFPSKYVERRAKNGNVYKCIVVTIDKDFDKLLFLERAESRYLDLLYKNKDTAHNITVK